MAKKAKKETIKEDDLLGSEVTVEDLEKVTEAAKEKGIKTEQPSVEKSKDKVLLGYHPITGAEVWQ